MTPDQIAQSMLSEHNGNAEAALRDLASWYVHRENELEREIVRLRKGVSWGAIRTAHLNRKSILPMKPPPPPALDVAKEQAPL